MPRRVTLPGDAELFRPTGTGHPAALQDPSAPGALAENPAGSTELDAGATHSRRVRHDEKITVYVSREELLALEQARLELRGEHDVAVDRGRIVRAAVALALEGFASSGANSDLARRLAH